jgi:hypothetical protein
VTGFDTDRLADLLALTDTDRWRSHPADQARYITEMIDRAGQTVSTELVVTIAADVAVWAAQCGATTVDEAARRLPDAVDLDTLADCLGRLDALPDTVTIDTRPTGPTTVDTPTPEPADTPAPDPDPPVAEPPDPVAVPPLPAGQDDDALEAAAQVLFTAFSPTPDWTKVPESRRQQYRRHAAEIVAAYLAARPTPDS